MSSVTSARALFDLPVNMRDGVMLYADVYLPGGEAVAGGAVKAAARESPTVSGRAGKFADKTEDSRGPQGTPRASAGPGTPVPPKTSGAGKRRYPVILMRTPYDKSQAFARAAGTGGLGMTAVLRGFAIVVQDTRGRFSSEGEFNAFVNEAQDGYDTVEWIAKQAWCDGKVGMYGGSYVGATQWLAAKERPPHLTAIAPFVTASDYHEGWAYQGGAFSLGFNLSWTLWALTGRNRDNLQRRLQLSDERVEAMVDAADDMSAAFRKLPLLPHPDVRKEEAKYYYDWLSHPSDDTYWKRLRIEDFHQKVMTPSLNLGGWYDIFLMGTIRNFERMREAGGSGDARAGAQLVIGPWTHTGLAGNASGLVDYGQRAGTTGLDLDELLIRYYERWLMGKVEPKPAAQSTMSSRRALPGGKGVKALPSPGPLSQTQGGSAAKGPGITEASPVRIFVMGANVWRDEKEWPLKRAKRTRYYLHSSGRANTRRGDGTLSNEAPDAERPDSFLYDPLEPVPTRGGPLCCAPWPGGLPAGPLDQASKEERTDVLVYSTPLLKEDTEVTGPVKVTLWASSSCVDTDFTAMLLDVSPGGQALNLCDGIVRGRWRKSRSIAEPLKPGQAEKFEIDLVATSNLFKKGHRIRVEVSSSNFPRFDRNLNTGKGFDSSEVMVATNTVFHDAKRASYVSLDLVTR